jgi:hypothetical protein
LVSNEWIITLGQTVGSVKRQLLPEIAAYVNRTDLRAEDIRLRVKKWNLPGHVMTDDQFFVADSLLSLATCDDPQSAHLFLPLVSNWELAFEIMTPSTKPEVAKSSRDYVAYLRPWRAAAFAFDPVVEFVIHSPVSAVTDNIVRKKVEEVFGVPKEFVELARPKKEANTCVFCESFPSAQLDWSAYKGEQDASVLVHSLGSVTYFKDARDEEHNPSEEELHRMMTADKVRGLRGAMPNVTAADEPMPLSSSSTSTTSPVRREVGLTIYQDGTKPKFLET